MSRSAKTASQIGMMEGAFFVSRTELLHWVNGLLDVNLAKVEQCASGAVYCQILDACHPNTVAMQKVNWMAKVDHEYIPNYKVLQSAFDRHAIERNIQVDQLIRAKYQDNLEFLQWMKAYWERSGAADLVDAAGDYGYEPAERRQGKQLPAWAVAARRVGEKENVRPATADSADAAKARPAPKAAAPRPAAAAPRTTAPKAAPRPAASAPKAASRPASGGANAGQAAKAAQHQGELDELQGVISGLEEERDYYFHRLREVELLCTRLQEQQEAMPSGETVVADVLQILYAEDGAAAGGDQPAEA